MALLVLHALLLASTVAGPAAAVGAVPDNDTAVGVGNAVGTAGTTTAPILCNGAAGGCEPPPGQPLPIYGGPPPPAPASHAPCPPAAPVVCCGGGGGGQQQPQQPYYYAPPVAYVPYYNRSAASPPALPAAVGYCVTAAAYVLSWVLMWY